MKLAEKIMKNSNKIYIILLFIGISVLAAFSYITYIFYQLVQGTSLIGWTYLVASPTLFAILLILMLLFVGKEQASKEVADFLGGN
jgi:hypothetical protein